MLSRIWSVGDTAAAQSSEVPANGGLTAAGLFQWLWHVYICPLITFIINNCVENRVHAELNSKLTSFSYPAFQNIAAHVLSSHRRVNDATNHVKPTTIYYVSVIFFKIKQINSTMSQHFKCFCQYSLWFFDLVSDLRCSRFLFLFFRYYRLKLCLHNMHEGMKWMHSLTTQYYAVKLDLDYVTHNQVQS